MTENGDAGRDGGGTPPDFARRERLETLGATLASVAHELNNPLTAITGFAQLLLDQLRDPADRVALEIIRREAERSSRIVRELLALARGDAGEVREPVDVNDVVLHVVRARQYAQSTRRLECTTALAHPAPVTIGGRRQLEQVVLNLVTNAEQATESRVNDARTAVADGGSDVPRIAITTQLDDADVHILVDDSGNGLGDDAKAQAWDAFWTTREGGTGLGLSVVRRIVEAHGGRVSAEASPLGGARLRVVLPAATGTQAPANARRALDILVIHDDPEHTEFLTRFLSARGHAVVCSRADRVAPVLMRMPFDVVISELASLRDGRAREHVNSVGVRSRLVVTSTRPPGRDELPDNAIFVREPFDVELLRRATEEGH